LRGLVGTFEIIQDSVQIYCDSQRAILFAKDHIYYKQRKHNDMRYYMIRHSVAVKNVIDLIKISTKKYPADMMTKIVPVEKFRVSLNFIKVL